MLVMLKSAEVRTYIPEKKQKVNGIGTAKASNKRRSMRTGGE